MENECYKLQKVQFDMFELLKRASYNFEYKMKEKKIKFELIGGKFIIEADQDRIFQVITNILSNAIKYTNEEDKISIKLYRESKYLVCEIIDTGVGISQEEIPYIFERFYRADKSRNRKTGGAGIGLAITKSIVQSHDGKIEVKSKLGEGSSFKIILPL
ncbi:Alkaline phosphatase synthesis sensor protein PhoR [bioreactor metagenome]|uniref:histidine kinase n=1 Tax=bioreactor metagenome TaxID=1076179 RepID=A0A645IPF7_9ZZZZ